MSDHRSLQVSKSFSRLETSALDPAARHRVVESPTLEPVEPPPDAGRVGNGDLFEQGGSEDGRGEAGFTQANSG